MLLNKNAFANSIALLIGLFYIILYVINLVSPSAFKFLFNAQFSGADVTSLIPPGFSLGDFIVILIVVIITGWIIGYMWAALYNRFAR